MTLLVDELRVYSTAPAARRYGTSWCHLVSDASLEELHAFADLLGLRRAWFQNGRIPHYDITASKRKLALTLGASAADYRTLWTKAVRA